MMQFACQIGIVLLLAMIFLGLLYRATKDSKGLDAFFAVLRAISIVIWLFLLFEGAGAFSAL
jgi:hypothetical protein